METLSSVTLSFIGLTVLALISGVIFHSGWTTPSWIRSAVINISLSLFSVSYLFIVAEFSLRTFLLHSDGGNRTLVSQQWHKRYWHPINSQSYRDYEHDWNRPTLFIVGDSFIAGHGINDISDRLSSMLSNRLKNRWTVATLAKNGWSTLNQYQALQQHQKKPDRIIVSYYINDIVNAASQHGLIRATRNTQTERQNNLIRYLSKNSFLFNWFDLNVLQKSIADSHNDYFKKAYGNQQIWETHTRELKDIIVFSKSLNAKLSFVIWPKLTDLQGSKEYTDKVQGFLHQQNVETINLSKSFRGRSPGSLIVNKWDGHPSVKTNREVAEILYRELAPWD